MYPFELIVAFKTNYYHILTHPCRVILDQHFLWFYIILFYNILRTLKTKTKYNHINYIVALVLYVLLVLIVLLTLVVVVLVTHVLIHVLIILVRVLLVVQVILYVLYYQEFCKLKMKFNFNYIKENRLRMMMN